MDECPSSGSCLYCPLWAVKCISAYAVKPSNTDTFRLVRRLCTALVFVIVDVARSQFHVFKLKPNLKRVVFKNQSYSLLISPGFGQRIGYFLLAKRLVCSWPPQLGFHSATALLPRLGLSLHWCSLGCPVLCLLSYSDKAGSQSLPPGL